jgi:hypothetical protein
MDIAYRRGKEVVGDYCVFRARQWYFYYKLVLLSHMKVIGWSLGTIFNTPNDYHTAYQDWQAIIDL